MSYPRVAFPDATAIVIGIVRAEVDPGATGTPHVGARVPTPRLNAPVSLDGAVAPEFPFIRCRRVGGPRLDVATDGALVTVEAWGTSEIEAMALAEQARVALSAARGQAVDGTTVYRVTETAGPALFPDPNSNSPRAVFTVQIHMRGAAA